MLVEEGASIDVISHDSKRTMLHEACAYGGAALVAILIEYGGDVDSRCLIRGFSPLHCCVETDVADRGVACASYFMMLGLTWTRSIGGGPARPTDLRDLRKLWYLERERSS